MSDAVAVFVDWVADRAAAVTPLPPPRPVYFAPEVVDEPATALRPGLGYAEGQSFMIEYVDSKGSPSSRRITVWGLVPGAGGVPCLIAQCHERRAQRQFRVDRIRSVIDYDGEVHENVVGYLSEVFGGDFAALAERAAAAPTNRWASILSVVRDHASILNVLAHVDGRKTPDEVDAITRYLRRLLRGKGVDVTDGEILALERYVARLRPSTDRVKAACDELLAGPPDGVGVFLRAAVDVMNADDVQHEAEVAMINAVSRHLTGMAIVA